MTHATPRSRTTDSGRQNAVHGRGTSKDAIALLKADHRQVEEWFRQFQNARSSEKRAKLAQQICQALRVHMLIEEKIFYPAFLEATGNKDIHHEAEIEHHGARQLIHKIEAAGPGDEYFESRIKVLSEMIKHHVKEEEKPDGMFAEARDSDMDLKALGEELQRGREQAMAEQMQGGGSAS